MTAANDAPTAVDKTVSVAEDDKPVVTITAVTSPVVPGEMAEFTVSRSNPNPEAAPMTSDALTVKLLMSEITGEGRSRELTRGLTKERGQQTVMILPGQEATIYTVATLDDMTDKPNSAVTAALLPDHTYDIGDPSSATVTIATVRDSLPVPWLIRFGRSVSRQVVDALQGRFSAPVSPGLDLTVAGEELTRAKLQENQQVLSKVLGFEAVTAQQLVEESSFSFAPAGEGDGASARFALWGAGGLSSFSGQQDNVSLDGDVTTALVGAEWSAARWRAGAALSRSWGNGAYAGQGEGDNGADGDVSGALTGIFPYGRYGLTPRLDIWAIAGIGWGNLSLQPDGRDVEYTPDASLTMTAVGMDGLLVDGGAEGFSLTATADVLTVRTTSEAVDGLASSEDNISRSRLALAATRPVPLSDGSSLVPSLEMGIRQDSGDAETGFGMELDAGLSWNDPERGISGAIKGRTLLFHMEEEFREQGLALSFSWDPNPSNRGPSFSLSHAVGATVEVGLDALLDPTALEMKALDAAAASNGQQLFATQFAYGFPAFDDRLTLTPGGRLALSSHSRTYSLLWALSPYVEQQQPQAEPWELSLEGSRQEDNTADSPVEHSLKLRFSLFF